MRGCDDWGVKMANKPALLRINVYITPAATRVMLCSTLSRVVDFLGMEVEVAPESIRWIKDPEMERCLKQKDANELNVKILDLDIRSWKLGSRVYNLQFRRYKSRYGRLDDKIWVVNKKVLKDRNKLAMTDIGLATTVPATAAQIPQGLAVFDPLDCGLTNPTTALSEMKLLFTEEDTDATVGISRPPENYEEHTTGPRLTILFLSPEAAADDTPETHVYMPRALQMLDEKGKYKTLIKYIRMHATAIQNTLNASDDEMERCSLTFVKYEAGRGLIAHIDGIKDFGNTFGPIFTITMGAGPGVHPKYLDMMPILTDEADDLPVRLQVNQFEITMLQGCARTAWSHSIPFGNPDEQYTIAFKFPAIIPRTHAFYTEPYICTTFGTIQQIRIQSA